MHIKEQKTEDNLKRWSYAHEIRLMEFSHLSRNDVGEKE